MNVKATAHLRSDSSPSSQGALRLPLPTNQTVLAIDDSQAILTLLPKYLKHLELGVRVEPYFVSGEITLEELTAAIAGRILEMFAKAAPPDLIVFDYSLSPNESSQVTGVALCKSLGESFKNGRRASWWEQVPKVLYTAGVFSGSVGDRPIDELIGEDGFRIVVNKMAPLEDQLAYFRSMLAPEPSC